MIVTHAASRILGDLAIAAIVGTYAAAFFLGRWSRAMPKAIEADCEASHLDVSALEEAQTGAGAVMLWLDIDGGTYKVVLPEDDARRLHADLTDALAVLDDEGGDG